MSEPWEIVDDGEQDLNEYTRVCVCGCTEVEHTQAGCLFCLGCEGFTYDPDMTLLEAIFKDFP